MAARRHRALLAIAAILVIGLTTTAWMVGSRVQSSSQAAARAEPPEPSLLTAPVERRVLSATVVTRADVVPAGSVAVSGPTLDAQGGAGSGIVTGVFVARGDEVTAGMRVVEVAGRPVFVFAGETPAFRAMRPGMTGRDIAQLQAGLMAAGCEAGGSGVYDQATKACVEQFYTDAGYTVVRSSETEVADLAAARAAVVEAEDGLALAENELAAVAEPAQSAAVSAAQAAVNDAKRAHDTAAAQHPQLIDGATRQADDAVASAVDALHVAAHALATVQADPAATVDAVSAAQAAVNDAQRVYDAAVAQHPELIDTARRNADTAVASTADALQAARDALAELQTGPNVSAQQLTVEQQRRSVERASQALAELEVMSGPVVPFGEIVFVPELSARVDAVGEVVGSTAAGSGGSTALIVLAAPVLEAHLSIPQADRALVQEGMSVELLYEATGETVTGTVRSIGTELEPSSSSAVPAYPAVIDADLPDGWSGINLRATFTAASTTDEVLVVPSAAVSSAADGQTRVQIERPGRTVDTVPVVVGLSADGFVEITPEDPALIDIGDRVLIGR